jgi:GNAT superfamily N-acetyltransferase
VAITGIEIRRAHRSDAEQIALAHRDSILSVGGRFYPQQIVDDWQEGVAAELYLEAMNGGEVFFIATGQVDGRSLVLGFASDYRIEGTTHGTSVYVRGLASRRGIGSALLRRAEAHAADTGATRIQIEASLAGAAFYAANGFTEIGRGETRLRSGRPIACVFMRKDLDADHATRGAAPAK